MLTYGDGLHAIDALRNHSRDDFAVAIVDLLMPRMDGLQLLPEIRRMGPATQVLMLTGTGTIQTAVAAMRMGASDFIEKPFDQVALREKVHAGIRVWAAKRAAVGSAATSGQADQHLIGESEAMKAILDLARRMSDNDALVLIQGESGTGKEQFAKAVHDGSRLASEPFVPIDTSTLGASVVESELFGHTKGAFTGAHSTRQGLLRAAGRGTVFLDEVGDLPLELQTRLLRVLQERTVRPVGSERAYPVEARLMAATHRNLLDAVNRGEFRDDLYHRLNVVAVTMPPLRDHKEDIASLASHFLRKYGKKRPELTSVSAEALTALRAYDWPGNVRELENAILRAVVIGTSDTIRVDDLPAHIATGGASEYAPADKRISDSTPDSPLAADSQRAGGSPLAGGTLAAYERDAIVAALEAAHGNRTLAAEILDIGVATLYRKIRKYQIQVAATPLSR